MARRSGVKMKWLPILLIGLFLIPFSSGLLSINSGGSGSTIADAGADIEGFFFGQEDVNATIPPDSAGGGGGGVITDIPVRAIQQERIREIILETAVWIIALILLIILGIVLDILRRRKKISIIVEVTTIGVAVLLIFLGAWVGSNLILDSNIEFAVGSLIAVVAFLILLTVGLIADVLRQQRKITGTTEIISLSILAIVLGIIGFGIFFILDQQSVDFVIGSIILGIAAVILIIVGIVIDLNKRLKR